MSLVEMYINTVLCIFHPIYNKCNLVLSEKVLICVTQYASLIGEAYIWTLACADTRTPICRTHHQETLYSFQTFKLSNFSYFLKDVNV